MSYSGFTTWCSFCGEGEQEANRWRAAGGETTYLSCCTGCGEDFTVRVPTGTPAQERESFLGQMGTRWTELRPFKP